MKKYLLSLIVFIALGMYGLGQRCDSTQTVNTSTWNIKERNGPYCLINNKMNELPDISGLSN